MNVDSVVVISVREAEERRKMIREKWSCDKIKLKFHIVDRQDNPTKGCFISHIDTLREATQKNMSRVLVLEDDAVPTVSIDYLVEKVNKDIRWLNNNKPDWEYFTLGYFPIKSQKTSNEGILKLQCALLSHAYIANLENIKIPEFSGLQVDNVLFCNFQDKIRKMNRKSNNYGSYPILVIQEAKDSYINKFHADVQTNLLHIVGQDRMARYSCLANTIGLMVFIIMFIILTSVLVPLYVYKDEYPGTFIGYLVFYILFLFSLLVGITV